MSAGHQEGKDHSHLQGCPGPMSKQLGLAWAAPCPLPSPGPIPVKDKPPQIRPFWHLAWAGPVQGVLMRPGLQVVQTMFYCAAKPSAPPTLTQCWLEPCWRRPGQGGPLGFLAPPSQWPALSSFLATPRGIFWSSFTPPSTLQTAHSQPSLPPQQEDGPPRKMLGGSEPENPSRKGSEALRTRETLGRGGGGEEGRRP